MQGRCWNIKNMTFNAEMLIMPVWLFPYHIVTYEQ